MEAKHTPAPWRVQDKPGSGYGKEFRIFSDRGDVLKGDQLEPDGISIGEAKANAALIVRAINCHDDLLAACRGLIATMDYMREKRPDLFGETEGTWLSPQMSEGYQLARAAIAKAEGR